MTSVNMDPATVPPAEPQPAEPHPALLPTAAIHREYPLYLWSAALTVLAVAWIMKLWHANLDIPFWYSGPALAGASLFKGIFQNGWYTTQPHLGAPYGQFYTDATSPGDLNAFLAKMLADFTGQWAATFNVFFLLGFVFCALTAVWFFRTCRLGRWFSVISAVLFAVAPYHFLTNENQIFLASYFCVPLAMVLVLRIIRAEQIWGRRARGNPRLSLVTGRGAGTALILVLLAYNGKDYVLFTFLLMGFAGVFGLIRSWNRSRLLGLVAAELLLAVAFGLNTLPGIIRRLTAGPVVTPARLPGSEASAFKLASLLFPAPGHPVAYLAKMRALYDTHYPEPGETPALGVVAAVGLLVLLMVAVTALTGLFQTRTAIPEWTGQRRLLDELAFLTLFAFALGVVGGLGTVLSHFADGYSGWGRICIIISLFTLAAFGICAEEAVRRLVARRRAHTTRTPGPTGRQRTTAIPVAAVMVLLVGLADQSLTGAVPAYQSNAAAYSSDQKFVDSVQSVVPKDAMIFQLPFRPFSDTGSARYPPAGAQLSLWLHSSTLRFSGGGIAGRGQTDWPAHLVNRATPTLLQGLAAIGFAGIAIDRSAYADRGQRWVDSFRKELGGPQLASRDSRYLFYSLAAAATRLDASTTSGQRAALAASITGVTP